jgi:hypothetical protein
LGWNHVIYLADVEREQNHDGICIALKQESDVEDESKNWADRWPRIRVCSSVTVSQLHNNLLVR